MITLVASTFFLFAQPGICDGGALRYRVTLGEYTFMLPHATPEGRCLPLAQFYLDQLNAKTLEIACGYTDGRPMTGWVVADPLLALNDGRCSDDG